jgi:PiT family inorganic phosphate transporter
MIIFITVVLAAMIFELGVGAAKRFSGVKWTVVERIIWAWVLTVPATALLGYILSRAATH